MRHSCIYEVSDKPLLERIFDINYWLPDDLLMEVDKMTMATSLEARVPFLDPNLLQLVCNVPSAMDLKKRLLKLSVQNILPNDVMRRKKHGFNAPVKEWFKSDTLDTYLSNEKINNTQYPDRRNIREILNRYKKGIVIAASCCGNVCVMLRGMISTLIKRLIAGAWNNENI